MARPRRQGHFEGELAALPPALWARLTEAGFGEPGLLATFRDDSDQELAEFLKQLGLPVDEAYSVPLRVLVEQAAVAGERERQLEASLSPYDRLLRDAKRRRKDHDAQEEIELQAVEVPEAPIKKAVPARWPTRRQRRNAGAPNDQTKRAIEEGERQRWLAVLAKIFKELNFPIALPTDEGRDGLRWLGKGKRAKTLRGRARSFKRIASWMQSVQDGEKWPASPQRLVDYMEARAAEPCGKTVLPNIVTTINFMEDVGGVAPEDRLDRQGLLSSALQELQLEVHQANGPQPKKRALRLFLRLVIALEMTVMDEEIPPYHRGFAWLKLLKVWGALRADDLTWLSVPTMRLGERGFIAALERTKVTGAGKLVEHLEVVVSVEAYLIKEAWLQTGYELWMGMMGQNNFMVGLPTEDMMGMQEVAGAGWVAIRNIGGLSIDQYKGQEAGGDARIMPITLTVGGRERRPWRDVVALCSQCDFPDWPVPGPLTVLWCAEFINRRGGGPRDHHRWWLSVTNLNKDSWGVAEHESAMKALDEAGSYDGLEITNLASLEVLLRRAQLVEYVYQLEGKEPKGKGGGKANNRFGLVDEAAVFSGSHRSTGDIMICPDLMDYVAKEVERDAQIMKQVRKAREERKALNTGKEPGG